MYPTTKARPHSPIVVIHMLIGVMNLQSVILVVNTLSGWSYLAAVTVLRSACIYCSSVC